MFSTIQVQRTRVMSTELEIIAYIETVLPTLYRMS